MSEKEAVKKLTQAQKNYLVKRINDIANTKISKLGGTANYGANRCYHNGHLTGPRVSKHAINSDVLLAITKGTVKLRNKAELVAEIKSVIESQKNKGYGSLGIPMFLDLKSLEKFNDDTNKKKEAYYKATQKRLAAVRDEADKLKDSVMLDGSLAIKLLDKFEKKEF